MENNGNNEEVISLKDIISIFKRYKISIIFVTLIFTVLGFLNGYYKPNIYEAKATIQVTADNQGGGSDIVKEALKGGSNGDIDTEISILKSRFLTLKAMKRVNVTTHIWSVDKFHKSRELYKDSPISVDIIKGKDTLFKLIPINKDTFRLVFNDKNKKMFKYGKDIKYKNYELVVNKSGKPFNEKVYKFIEYKPVGYAEGIIGGALGVQKLYGSSKVLKISYKDTIPQRAKDFVNALIDEYMKQNSKMQTRDATKTLEFINSQLAIISGELKNSEQQIEHFKTQQKTVNVSSNVERISKSMSDLENKVAILNMQISMLRNVQNSVKRNRNLDTLTLAGTGIKVATITKAIQDLQDAMLKRRVMLKEFTPAHPKVQELSTKIANLKTIIKKSIANTLKSLQQKRNLLVAQMKKYQKSIKKLPKVQQNYLSLERKFTFNEKFYTYLLEKKTEAQIKKAATSNTNRIIDAAILPMGSIAPNRKKIMLMGFAIGLILGMVLAFIRAFLDDTIKEKSDVMKGTNVPIVASIPKFFHTSNRDSDLIVASQPNSYVSESFRVLRTNLQFVAKKENAKVIAITSTVANEGKTTVAANLGTALQMMNKKVVVLNFDLRKPALHKIFEVSNKKGLSDYLAGKVSLEEIIKGTKRDNLDIITSGTVPPNPSELIASGKTDELIDRLKQIYDYVILDTPPVGIVTDARLLLSKSDIILYIIKADYSKKEFLETVNMLKQEEDVRNIGIVLNNLKNKRNYGYQYGYYK